MDSQSVFAQLRDILTELYPDVESARRVGDDAGINLGQINFNTGAINFWHAILAEAVHTGKSDSLLNDVLAEYGAHRRLSTAYNAYVAAGKRLIPPPPPGTSKAEQRAYANRQAMLKLVHDIWVKGVLEHSLYNQLLIDLDMEQHPEAVERPWGMVLETPAQASRLLPAGTKMVDVFAECNQSLLILGEPGSGKSTMLLELARDLLAQAEQNPALPMPVLFNLSSWAEKRQPLRQWLVDELREKYQIPKTLAQAWVEHDELLLLLDGLDEVKPAYREECIKALNEFQQSCQALVSLALCSRMAEYVALTSKLKLNGAIVLRPLTSHQIDTFLLRASDKLSVVAHLLQRDAELQTLAQSPLTFSILCLTYQDKAVADIERVDGMGTRLQQLFDAYIMRMFQRRGKLTVDRYPRAQTLRWLAWLAKNMNKHQQTIFLIERLQPDWLQARARWLYGLLGGLLFGLLFGLDGRLGIGLSVGLFSGLFSGLRFSRDIKPTERLVFSWGIDKEAMRKWLIIGLSRGLFIGLLLGLVLGPGFNVGLHRSLLLRLVLGLLFGLGSGLVLGLVSVLLFGLVSRLIRQAEAIQHIHPNQGIWHSARNMWIGGIRLGLLSGLSIGLLTGLISGLFFWLAGEDLISGLFLGLFGGLLFGLGGWLKYGGFACIQHMILRGFLCLYNYAPLNYARFLDYCAERIFLHKVGGGYIFIHRLLLEHFASLTEEDIQRLAKGS